MSAVVPDHLPGPAMAALSRHQGAYQAALGGALAALGFFLLWSTAGTSIALFFVLVLGCLAPAQVWRLAPWREPVVAAGLALLAYIALRTFVGEGLRSETVGWVNHYHELLMVPLLCAAMRLTRRRELFLWGLVAGAVGFAAMYWLVPVLSQPFPRLEKFFHLRRISAGFGFAVVAFLLLERARLRQGLQWLNLGAAAFLVLTVLFANDARTGHVVLLVLLACAAFRAAPPRLRLPAVLVILLATLALASLSPGVRSRIAETLQDARGIASGASHNSTAARLEQLHNGALVARDHWVAGTGWSGYREAFEKAASPRHASGAQVLGAVSDNPHNEYLMQLGAGGLPALLLFMAWLAAPVWRAARAGEDAGDWRGAAASVALAFAVCALLNSVLLDFVEGHIYGAVLAWLLAYGGRPARG